MGETLGDPARGIALALLLALAVAPGAADAARIGGPFELVDQHGATRTDADFRGAYTLIYFGYTYCPDLCPTTLMKVSTAIDELAARSPGDAARVVPIFVSVDPARDTPELLGAYAQDFHPRLVALTGTPKALADVGRRFGAYAGRVPAARPDEYLMDHTTFVYLMGPDGGYLEHFEGNATADELLAALQRHLSATATGGS